jgi:hypothetical protein
MAAWFRNLQRTQSKTAPVGGLFHFRLSYFASASRLALGVPVRRLGGGCTSLRSPSEKSRQLFQLEQHMSVSGHITKLPCWEMRAMTVYSTFMCWLILNELIVLAVLRATPISRFRPPQLGAAAETEGNHRLQGVLPSGRQPKMANQEDMPYSAGCRQT